MHCTKAFAFVGICAVVSGLAGCGLSPPATPHVVLTPNQPTIQEPTTSTTWPAGRIMFFETDPVSCSQDHTVQYRWSWGDGTYSRSGDGTREWLYIESWYHTYSTPGEYAVKVMARCARDHSVTSPWSDPLVVTIEEAEDPPPTDWVVVGRWKGTGSRTTETFYVEAREWRVKWSLRDTEPGRDFDPWVSIRIRDSEDRRVDSVMSDDLWGVSYVHHGPGRYFLRITGGIYTEWEVTAEVRRSD